MAFEKGLYFIPCTYNHLQHISPHFNNGLTGTAKRTEKLSYYRPGQVLRAPEG